MIYLWLSNLILYLKIWPSALDLNVRIYVNFQYVSTTSINKSLSAGTSDRDTLRIYSTSVRYLNEENFSPNVATSSRPFLTSNVVKRSRAKRSMGVIRAPTETAL